MIEKTIEVSFILLGSGPRSLPSLKTLSRLRGALRWTLGTNYCYLGLAGCEVWVSFATGSRDVLHALVQCSNTDRFVSIHSH